MKRPVAILASLLTAATCMTAFTSCGDDRLYMPDLSGIDFEKAKEEFDFLELTISAEAQSSTTLKGKIMEQSIRPGAKITEGQNVLLTISSGEDTPRVFKDGVDTGETVPPTTELTTEIITTTAVSTEEVPTTTVLEPGMFVMPNFRGVLLSEAVEEYGDKINFQIKEYTDSDLAPGQIVRQDVTEGTPCDSGTTLYVTIANGAFSGGNLTQQETTETYDYDYNNGYDNSWGYDNSYDYNDYGYDYNNYGYDNGYDNSWGYDNGYYGW